MLGENEMGAQMRKMMKPPAGRPGRAADRRSIPPTPLLVRMPTRETQVRELSQLLIPGAPGRSGAADGRLLQRLKRILRVRNRSVPFSG